MHRMGMSLPMLPAYASGPKQTSPPASLLPKIQVSTPEMAFAEKYNRESRAFWDKTDELLNELQSLHKHAGEIVCPCKNPKCPFLVKDETATITSTRILTTPPLERGLGHRLRKVQSVGGLGTTTGARLHNGFNFKNNSFAHYGIDTNFAIEEEDSHERYEFKRNSPARRPRRRPLQGKRSLSYSQELHKRESRLSLPSQPSVLTPSVRSLSLPGNGPGFCFDLFQFGPEYDIDAFVEFQRQWCPSLSTSA